MKTKLLAVLAMLCYYMSNAQTAYRSYFGESYTKWYILYDGYSCPNTFDFLVCSNRTEIINENTYWKLFEVFEPSDDNPRNSMPANESTYKFLREDTLTGKLYYRYKIYSDYGTSYSPDILVSDMTLKVGDSVKLGNININFWKNVVKTSGGNYYAIVDSVYQKNSLKHIRTSALFSSKNELFDNDYTSLTFIEGIGSNLSPILDYDGMAYLSDVWKLICFVSDDSLTYFNNKKKRNLPPLICDVGVRNINEDFFSTKIIPSKILLQFHYPFYGEIRLIQLTGSLLYQRTIRGDTEHTINTINYSNGIYILQITHNNAITTKKIILN